MKKGCRASTFSAELIKWVVALSALGIFCMGFGCGGGGDEAPPPPPPSTATLSGIASKGLINGGDVNVYEIDEDGQKVDPALGKTKTDKNGEYSIVVDHIGPVLAEVIKGDYTDEATGALMRLDMPLRAAVGEAVGEVTVAVTPLTELAVRKAGPGGFTPKKIDDSNELMSQLVGCNIVTTLPADPDDLGAAGVDSQRYALFLAALSQMAANKGTDIAKIIDAIEKDLDDLILDKTGADIRLALDDYISNMGIKDDHGLGDHISEIKTSGLEPTGDLGQAKIYLVEFLNDPTKDNYTIFIDYMNTFVPQSEEAHLFIALAELADIYNSNAFSFITDELGINFDTDFESIVPERIISNLLRVASYQTYTKDLLAELELRLDIVDRELDLAQGVNTFISLTGFNTIYFDNIDVKVLRAFTQALKAVCAYIQAVDFQADNWRVSAGDSEVDIRDLVGNGDHIADQQKAEFITKNENFLTYSDLDKLDTFTTAFLSAQDHFNSAVTAVNDIGESGRRLRRKNAFNMDTPYRLLVLRAVRDETLPSIVRAFDNWYESIITVGEEVLDKRIIVADDGYAYYRSDYALYLKHYAPANEQITTLYHLVNGIKSPRHVWEDYYSARQDNEDYRPYCELEHERTAYPPYPVAVPDTEWDHPIDTYIVQEVAIEIDGKSGEWGTVPTLYEGDNIKIKLARYNRDKLDDYYLYVYKPAGFENPIGGSLEYPVNLYMEMPFSGEFYIAEVVYKWDGQGSLKASEYGITSDEDEVKVADADMRLIERFGSVIGFEVKFSHFSRLVKAGSINQFCYGSICNSERPKIKLLPEAGE
jgi:hypothetical protein